MITKFMWEGLLDLDYDEIEIKPLFILIGVILSCISIPFDLLLLPFEIVAIIINKILSIGDK